MYIVIQGIFSIRLDFFHFSIHFGCIMWILNYCTVNLDTSKFIQSLHIGSFPLAFSYLCYKHSEEEKKKQGAAVPFNYDTKPAEEQEVEEEEEEDLTPYVPIPTLKVPKGVTLVSCLVLLLYVYTIRQFLCHVSTKWKSKVCT